MFGKKPAASSDHPPREEKATVVLPSTPAFPNTETVTKSPAPVPKAAAVAQAPAFQDSPASQSFTDANLVTPDFVRAKDLLVKDLLEQINFDVFERMPKEMRKARISETVDTLMKGV